MKWLIIDNFKRTRNATIELAEAIPREHYDECVASELHHISWGVGVWLDGRMRDGKGTYEKSSSKDELLEMLRSSRVRLLDYWMEIDEGVVSPTWFLDFVLYITAHEAHHRGKVVKHLEGRGVPIPFMPREHPGAYDSVDPDEK